ncbi:MAG: hypothetical protein R3D98_04720 [Candidatus Krumholzibacteriia bacterium]
MSVRHAMQGLLVTCILLGWGGLATAQAPADPILKFDSSSKVELDLSAMVDDLMPLLRNALEEAGDDDRQTITMLIDLLGVEALDRLEMESRSTRDRASSKLVLTLDPEKGGGLLAEMLALPQGKCRFARYVTGDQLLTFMTVQNFRDHLGLVLDLLARPEFAEMTADLPRNDAGEVEMAGFNPRRDLLPLLSGELDVFMLTLPEDEAFNPMAMPVYLVLGTEDGPALRDRILALADALGGGDQGGPGEMLRSLPVETVGDFELTVSPFGVSYAVSRDFFILGMAPAPLRAMLAAPRGDLRVPDGRSWMVMNGKEYGQALRAIMAMAGDQAGQAEWMNTMSMQVLSHIDSEVVHTTSSPGRLTVEAEVDGAVMTGLYAMLHDFMLKLPELMEQQRLDQEREQEVSELRGIVAVLDAAFASYGADHDGHFPTDPHELVTAGYLDEFPLAESTPPGVYREGAYTYHPLYDDDGLVVGYFLFVYGGGEDTGYDMYSAENIGDPDDYFLDSDGIPDGIATYCYDGVAIELMEEW